MSEQTSPGSLSTRLRRLGALGSAAAVAVVGLSALSAETASAAGVRTPVGHSGPAPTRGVVVDPAAVVTTTPGTTSVTYRYSRATGLTPA